MFNLRDSGDRLALPYAAAGAVQGASKYYPAVAAWAALGTGVVTYDVWAVKTGNETLSHAFHRAYESHPMSKFMLIGAIGALALHLLHET